MANITRVLVAGSSRPHAEALGVVLDAQHGIESAGVALTPEETLRRVEDDGIDLVVAQAELLDEADWSDLRATLNGQAPSLVLVARDQPLTTLLEAVGADRQAPVAASASGLTKRERSVLELLGQALPPKQVAQELGISVHTCRGYVKTILDKLDIHSILEAVLEGQRRGLLPPEAPRPLP